MAEVNIHTFHALGLEARARSVHVHGPSSKFPFHERALLGERLGTGHPGHCEERSFLAQVAARGALCAASANRRAARKAKTPWAPGASSSRDQKKAQHVGEQGSIDIG